MTNKLYVKEIKGKGRGVFCKETIYKDEAIEICPLLVLPSNDFNALSSTQLIDYIFNFNTEEKTIALALGFGSLYNHHVYPNAAYILNRETNMMSLFALSDIPADKEISINYKGVYGKDFKEWFDLRNIEYQEM